MFNSTNTRTFQVL